MKTKVIYTWFMLLSVALLTGCYDDKGGNDFDTTLPDVVMTIPEDVYSGSLGDSIIIKPKIETSIDSNDLEYFWEVNGATTNNMCYYATPDGVYNYGVDGSTLYTAHKIQTIEGKEYSFKGIITMMKLLASDEKHNPLNITLKNDDPVLMVATWDGSESHIYALHISDATGQVKEASVYDKSTVSGWNFGKIYDANIKVL